MRWCEYQKSWLESIADKSVMGLIEHCCYWDNFKSTIKFTVSPIYYVSKVVNWSAIWWELCKLSSFTYSQIGKASVLQVARLAHQAFYPLNFNTIFIFQSVDKAQMWFALLEDFYPLATMKYQPSRLCSKSKYHYWKRWIFTCQSCESTIANFDHLPLFVRAVQESRRSFRSGHLPYKHR